MDILWEQFWAAGDEARLLRCLMNARGMVFEIINPALDQAIEYQFEHYSEATTWLDEQDFVYQPAPVLAKPDRRETPQEKKARSYRLDSRTLPMGHSVSRRGQKVWPKLRRRQLRHRMKAFLREQLTSLYRDISDQSFRSLKADALPDFGETMPLEDALAEKQRRRKVGYKTTRSRQLGAFDENGRFARPSGEDDLPEWLRDNL